MKKFFVSTPIYYPNDIPHIGHAYSSLIADTLARYKRMTGNKVKFSTGVDENSQKLVLKAAELGIPMDKFLDEMTEKHQNVWSKLDISHTDFIRTSSPKHHKLVQEILQKTYDNGDIYQGEYTGMYCVGCEAFKKESDLTEDGLCPDHLKKPDFIKEKNYFFRLSKYQDKLLKFYEENPHFVTPENRFREVIEFVKQEGLEDFSISRETNKFGIPLPFDPTQVTYVWYDALLNYITVCQEGDEDFWPANLHIIGKDIIRFHAIYWPAMLMSVGYELPKQILATGFFTVDGQKMSKSLNNVIEPVSFMNEYSRELMSVYLFSAFPIGSDGDFSREQAVFAYNAKLANNIGNLLNRFIVLSLKAGWDIRGEMDSELAFKKEEFISKYTQAMESYNLRNALEAAFEFGDILNKYVDTTKPWEKKEGQEEELVTIMYSLWEGLRVIGLCLFPFFEQKMSSLMERMGLDYASKLHEWEWENLIKEHVFFTVKEKGEPLFPRI